MPRVVKNTARKSTGGKAPRRQMPGASVPAPLREPSPPRHAFLHLVIQPAAPTVQDKNEYPPPATKELYSHVSRVTREDLKVLDGYVNVYKGARRWYWLLACLTSAAMTGRKRPILVSRLLPAQMRFLDSNVQRFEHCVEESTDIDFCEAVMIVLAEHWPNCEVVGSGKTGYIHIEVRTLADIPAANFTYSLASDAIPSSACPCREFT